LLFNPSAFTSTTAATPSVEKLLASITFICLDALFTTCGTNVLPVWLCTVTCMLVKKSILLKVKVCASPLTLTSFKFSVTLSNNSVQLKAFKVGIALVVAELNFSTKAFILKYLA
jgi:hypothetical protein